MRFVVAAVLCAALWLAGCGSDDTHSSSPRASAHPAAAPSPDANADLAATQNVGPDLRVLMRGLVPPSERASLTADELKVHECGISPTFPCMNAFFSAAKGQAFAARLHRLRVLAVSKGWRVERVRREEKGVYLELVRGDVHARYTLSRLGGPADSIVEVSVAGPLTVLPAPSAADKAAWSPEKQRYVNDANAICSRAFSHITGSKQLPVALTRALRSLTALPPPVGERQQVATFLRPLRLIDQAARVIDQAKGEDVLPAVVAIAQYTTRFNKAASRYGLDKCALG